MLKKEVTREIPVLCMMEVLCWLAQVFELGR